MIIQKAQPVVRVHRVLPIVGGIFIVILVFFGVLFAHGIHSLWSHLVWAHLEPLLKDDQKTGLDEMKWTLGLILGTAVFFSLAQFAATWFNAETYTKKAEDALKRIHDVEEEIASQMPELLKLARNRESSYGALENRLREASTSNEEEGLDWRDNFYQEMRVEERQKLLSVERSIGFENLAWPESDLEYVPRLRRLANFFFSKFNFELRNGFANYEDLERAEYYLHLARERLPEAFYLLNDLGVVQLRCHSVSKANDKQYYFMKAEDFFQKSIERNPHQQRAYYNLAVRAKKLSDGAKKTGELAAANRYLQQAVRNLQQALKEKYWERIEIPAMHGNVCYNLGCYSALLAAQISAPANQAELLQICVRAFEECAAIGRVRKSLVIYDFDEKEGDIYPLTHSNAPELAQVARRLNELRPQLSANAEFPYQPLRVNTSTRERIKAAWRALTC